MNVIALQEMANQNANYREAAIPHLEHCTELIRRAMMDMPADQSQLFASKMPDGLYVLWMDVGMEFLLARPLQESHYLLMVWKGHERLLGDTAQCNLAPQDCVPPTALVDRYQRVRNKYLVDRWRPAPLMTES